MPTEGARTQLGPGVAREREREHRGSADGSGAARSLQDEEERGAAEPDEGDSDTNFGVKVRPPSMVEWPSGIPISK